MPKLPVISGEELVRLLVNKKGYSIRSRKGSHVNLVHSSLPPVTVPLHKELKRGLLHYLLEKTQISASEL